LNKLSKDELSATEQDGKTVIAWASENGLDSSPKIAVLKGRI
jgi:hypothetical protein